MYRSVYRVTIKSVVCSFLVMAAGLVTFGYSQSHDASKPGDPYFYYTGRTDFGDVNAPKLYYSGASITCVFEGTSVKATFTDYNYWGGGNKLEYFIDDEFVRTDSLVNGGANQTVDIATGLENGEHKLAIYKIGGPENGYLIFHGLQLDAGKGLLQPPEPAALKMECFGTSVASGEHAGCPSGECGNDNGYNAYPMVFARRFNAEMYNNGITGLAVCNSTGYFESGLTGLERTWDKLCPCNESGLKRTNWDFKKYTPQFMLMGMGINDKKINHEAITQETFITKYLEISLKLDSIYNHPVFLYCVDPLGSVKGTYFTLVKQIADSMKALGKKSWYYQYEQATSGGHPDSVESARMANELADFVEQEKLLDAIATMRNTPPVQKSMTAGFTLAPVVKNSAVRHLRVSIISGGVYTVSLSDLRGRTTTLLNETSLAAGTHIVTLPAGLPPGLRIAECRSGTGETVRYAIVNSR